MRTLGMQAPEPPTSQDRVAVTGNASFVLDGATAHLPLEISTTAYVDTLATGLTANLQHDLPLTDVLAAAIAHTAKALALVPGAAPSSTVAIARWNLDSVELLVLGDSQVAHPAGILRDDRLAQIAPQERAAFQRRLATGNGYDAEHAALLRRLQAEERRHRNADGGYWIAEAVPSAAQHAQVLRLPRREVPWLVLASDGAWEPMEHLGLDHWPSVAQMSEPELAAVLAECETWERETDPDGRLMPRAKRHDDKTLLVCRPEG